MEGIYLFETYAPLVKWTTFLLVLILEFLLGLKFKQGGVTATFLHVDIHKDEKV